MSLIELYKIIKQKINSGRYGWSGDYDSWDIVQKKSAGYQSHLILEKVKQSILKVKNGDAVYERDSVLFYKIEYSWPLVSALLWVYSKQPDHLNVMDFGGSLGSTYFQNRLFLNDLKNVKWSVIEQDNFVTCGKEYIGDDKLRFFHTTEESIREQGSPDMLILSCVLPYLEYPYTVLEQLISLEIPHIFIDNTFFNYEDRDRLTLQRVPPAIYPASYACWFLSYKTVTTLFKGKYDITSEHQNESHIRLDGHDIRYSGFLATLKKRNEDY